MKTPFLRRSYDSLRPAARACSVSRAVRRRQALGVEMLEDRVTLSLTPQMVLDINPGRASSSPSQLVVIGSTTYFTTDNGAQLWKSDGTAAGTVLFKGAPDASFGSSWDNLTNINGTLYFTTSFYTRYWELWKSDGTAAGTTRMRDVLISRSAAGNPSNLTNVNGTLFFAAEDQMYGYELWRSDGTAAGTTIVKDIYPGGAGGGYPYGGDYICYGSSPSNMTNVNGTLYFTADDGTTGRELWKSDGSAAGTVRVKDINPGSSWSNPGSLTNVNGTLFFAANNGSNGSELWKSDGSPGGTTLVKDINPGSAGSSPTSLTNLNGTLFFAANNGSNGSELWKSDGSPGGTTLVKDINPGSASSSPSNLTIVNGTLYFTANNGTKGIELWKSDGTPGGTTLVKDINPGSASSSPSNLTAVNGTLFFTADDGSGVRKLWQSDGTPGGTVPVTNLVASNLTNANGTLLFTADDGVHGQELWRLVDGPSQSTSLTVSGFPDTITAGVAGGFTVTARNADGTVNTAYRGTVHFTSSDPQAVLPADYTFTAADQGVHTFSATLKTAGSQSITTSDTVVPGGDGTQAGITVKAAAASRFTVAGFPSPVTAGVTGSITVTAWDAYGNQATGYTGIVRFTSSDAKSVLPGNITFTSADSGMCTFSAVLKTAGTQSLSATDTARAAIAGIQDVAVNPAEASALLVSAPARVNAGTKFRLTVTVVDAYGNVVTDYRGTIAFRSSDSTATLPKNYKFTSADRGVRTFSALVLKKKGKQTISVKDTLAGSLSTSVAIEVL